MGIAAELTARCGRDRLGRYGVTHRVRVPNGGTGRSPSGVGRCELFGRKEKPPARALGGEKIETLIGTTADFNGHLKSDGGVRVDGTFEGLIETAGNVLIGESAKVLADITARNVQVAGAVRGNVTASGRLEILATGRVWGDIHVSSFMIEEGGVFRGQSLMQAQDEPLLIEAPRAGEPVVANAAVDEDGSRPERGRNHNRSNR
jgi:cytoskeletal protein CcmA (bactofilin family)